MWGLVFYSLVKPDALRIRADPLIAKALNCPNEVVVSQERVGNKAMCRSRIYFLS